MRWSLRLKDDIPIMSTFTVRLNTSRVHYQNSIHAIHDLFSSQSNLIISNWHIPSLGLYGLFAWLFQFHSNAYVKDRRLVVMNCHMVILSFGLIRFTSAFLVDKLYAFLNIDVDH